MLSRNGPPEQGRNSEPASTMLALALAYAQRGLAIIPLHTPLFHHPAGYTCTCEAYRHSARCQSHDVERVAHGKEKLYLEPHAHCAHPGKHPRGLTAWLQEATTDPEIITGWFTRFPEAGIGCVPGRSGLIVIDLDEYKPGFAGGELLTAAEQATVTAVTGNGGRHLYFRKHPGARYSNANGVLPKGVDIRSDNGYIVLPGTLHASGKRYAWVPGRSIEELEPQLLPQRIHDRLMVANAAAGHAHTNGDSAHRGCAPVNFAAVSSPRPSTDRLPAYVAAMLQVPCGPDHDRSKHDFALIAQLVKLGYTDDEIIGYYDHYPVGRLGKYAARGRPYLARTIAAVRARVQAPVTGRGEDAGGMAGVRGDWPVKYSSG